MVPAIASRGPVCPRSKISITSFSRTSCTQVLGRSKSANSPGGKLDGALRQVAPQLHDILVMNMGTERQVEPFQSAETGEALQTTTGYLGAPLKVQRLQQ